MTSPEHQRDVSRLVELVGKGALFSRWGLERAELIAAHGRSIVMRVERPASRPLLSGDTEVLVLKVVGLPTGVPGTVASTASGREPPRQELDTVRRLAAAMATGITPGLQLLARVYDADQDLFRSAAGDKFEILGLLGEHFPDGDLGAWCRCTAPLDVDHLSGLVFDVATGLTALHSLGLVHHDVKPSNVFICRDPLRVDATGRPRAVLGDFGAVRPIGHAGPIEYTAAFSPANPAIEAGTPAFDVYSLARLTLSLLAPADRALPPGARVSPQQFEQIPEPALDPVQGADRRWWKDMATVLSRATSAAHRRPSAIAFAGEVQRITDRARARQKRRESKRWLTARPLLFGLGLIALMTVLAFVLPRTPATVQDRPDNHDAQPQTGTGELCWHHIASPTTERLRAVWTPGGDDAFIVGDHMTILRSDGRRAVQMPVPQDMEMEERLEAVWGTSADNVFACGSHGTLLRFDGVSWTEPRPGPGGRPYYRGIWGSSRRNIWFVNSGNPRHFNDRGWIVVNCPLEGDTWAVHGCSENFVLAVGFDGQIAEYDGSGWKMQARLSAGELRCVSVVSPQLAWAGGGGREHGALFQFDGSTWTRVTDAPVAGRFEGLWSASPDDLWAASQGGLFRWHDDRWSRVDPDYPIDPRGIHGSSTDNVWVVGGGGAIVRWSR